MADCWLAGWLGLLLVDDAARSECLFVYFYGDISSGFDGGLLVMRRFLWRNINVDVAHGRVKGGCLGS